MKYIVLDSNLLFIDDKRFHVTNWEFSKEVQRLLEAIRYGAFGKEVKLLVPELVIRELVIQRLEKYSELMDEIAKIHKKISGVATIDISIEEYRKIDEVKEQLDDWLKGNNIEIIPICEESYFDYLVDDALRKMPPFEGKDKQSDKGFKDAVIFYSLIAYAKENHGDFYFWTRDHRMPGDNARNNKDYFEHLTGSKLRFVSRMEEIADSNLEMNEILEKVEVEYEKVKEVWRKAEGKVFTELFYTRPQIKGNYLVVDVLNKEIEKVFLEDKAFWRGIYDAPDNEIDEVFFGELEGDVIYNDNGLLSIRFCKRICLGGVANPELFVSVYDINTGEKVSLNQLLKMRDDKIIDLVVQRQKEDSVLHPEKYWPEFVPEYKCLEDVHFYLSVEGLFIFYDVYEASCGADENVEFKLLNINEVVHNYRS